MYADDGYFSQTTYYNTEEAYEEHLKAAYPEQKQYRAVSSELTADEEDDEQFVMGAVKSVWVAEEYDEDGNVTESHLMSKEEMDDNGIPISPNSASPNPSYDFNDGGGIGGELYGEDSTTFHRLTIDAIVLYNDFFESYYVRASAHWKAEFVLFQDSKTAEHKYLDYFGITWGGNGALEAVSNSFTGIYHPDGNGVTQEVTYAKAYSDYTLGCVWEFNEKSSTFGKELNIATITAQIERCKPIETPTSIRVTYIHTYSKLDGSLTVGANTGDGFEGAVSISTEKGNWAAVLEFDRIT